MIFDFMLLLKFMFYEGKKFWVFGNLFYNIFILFMFYFFDYVDSIVDMYFMF